MKELAEASFDIFNKKIKNWFSEITNKNK